MKFAIANKLDRKSGGPTPPVKDGNAYGFGDSSRSD
jgi:hypothetical protein